MQKCRSCLSVLEHLYHVGPRTFLPFYIRKSRPSKMQIIYEEILAFRVSTGIFIYKCLWKNMIPGIKLWFTHSLSRTHLHYKKHCKKVHKAPTTYQQLRGPSGKYNSGTPQTNSLWQGDWKPRSPASSLAASIFHRCSLASSNFRIFFKWFSSCQLGTVQGAQLGELSQMDQPKAACMPDWD